LRLGEAQHDAQERGLARAVGPDEAEEVAGLHREVDGLEDAHLAVAERHVLELDERPHARAPRRGGASHHAAAAAHPAPRGRPPRRWVGQWAWSTTRAHPTRSIIAIATSWMASRAPGRSRSRLIR